MRFSANLSLLFTEVPMPERFALARQAGFQAVEIQFPYQWPAAQIGQALDDNGLQLVLFNVAADTLLEGGEGLAAVPGRQQDFRQAVALAAEYATLLKPACINVLPGRCYQRDAYTEYWATLCDNLRYACQLFAAQGVTTVFEAINSLDMPGFIIDSHASMLGLWEAVADPALRMQYDIYHMARMQQDMPAFWQQHLAKIAHIQFADCPGRHQPGTGCLDLAGLFRQLQTLGYQGYLGAEYKPSAITADSLDWLADFASRR